MIGLIPLDVDWKDRNEERLDHPGGPTLRHRRGVPGLADVVAVSRLKQPLGIIQITSCSSGEGKSSTLANLAVTFAGAGMKVAVVGCDLRKPRIHRFFHVDGSVGLTSVLIGDVTLQQALQTSPLHPNINVLTSGPRPPNPSELLSLDSTAMLLRALLDTHAVVFIDSPPVLPVTDALVLSRCVDASMFIANAGRTSRRQIGRAVERMRQVNSPLIGTILNGVAAEEAYGSLYEYYGYDEPTRKTFLRRFRKTGVADIPRLQESAMNKGEAETANAGPPV